ncbi:hypothetical protein GGG16DRAFT_119928 [Schizophyllum commune]
MCFVKIFRIDLFGRSQVALMSKWVRGDESKMALTYARPMSCELKQGHESLAPEDDEEALRIQQAHIPLTLVLIPSLALSRSPLGPLSLPPFAHHPFSPSSSRVPTTISH